MQSAIAGAAAPEQSGTQVNDVSFLVRFPRSMSS
jgi:hypothetical protein